MAGLDRHIHTTDAEEHARLAFRRDCPRCRVRLAGPPPSRDVVPVRAKGALVTALVLAAGVLPATSARAQDGGEELVEIDPPRGAGSSDESGPPISPPGDDGGEQTSPGGDEPSSSQGEASPPSAGEGTPGSESSAGDRSGSDAGEPSSRSSSGADGSAGDGGFGAGRSSESGGAGAPAGDDALVPVPDLAGPAGSDAGKARGLSGERQGGAGQGDDRGSGGGDRESAGGEEAHARGERYTIERGDCLWSIARDLLGTDASDAKVAAKVSELWELNDTEVIRTGDPDLIYPGQELRLA